MTTSTFNKQLAVPCRVQRFTARSSMLDAVMLTWASTLNSDDLQVLVLVLFMVLQSLEPI
jgi:hypothetical protein